MYLILHKGIVVWEYVGMCLILHKGIVVWTMFDIT